ncbi:DUF1778 domain-containing protein [Franzmannia qiaohouensis]|uniref:DUF1778 domain-containing protein n=1 Tax=Franzmannia qiaohouensis TaxID=1329370 RepID=A0ABU1HM54_9GAMM|nr:DUF1778 domain-containing protein [Halomonas qiaohouensis]MDR5907844.1 DUF1778 domain-containing protein [Halomonas qiaohouensis]
MSAVKRIDIRMDAETRQLAERASAASGRTMTQYLTQLIREDAPKILEEVANIRLTNDQFDNFMRVCSQEEPISDKIRRTASRLDKEGF